MHCLLQYKISVKNRASAVVAEALFFWGENEEMMLESKILIIFWKYTLGKAGKRV